MNLDISHLFESNKEGARKGYERMHMFVGWGSCAVLIFCLFIWDYVFGVGAGTISWTIITSLAIVAWVYSNRIFSYHENIRIGALGPAYWVCTVLMIIAALVIIFMLVITCIYKNSGMMDAVISGTDLPVSMSDIPSLSDVVSGSNM